MTPDMSRHHTSLAVGAVLVLLAAVVGALALSSPAAAITPCGKKVLEDWYDNGRIDRLYPPHCYEEAIDGIPSDIGPYVDAEEVISRALQSALRNKLAPGGCDPSADGSADDCANTGGNSGSSGGSSSGGSSGSSGGSSGGSTGGKTGGTGGKTGTGGNTGTPTPPDTVAAPEVETSATTSVPIPLLVLGGMSVALLAAGGLGYLARRRQAVYDSDSDTLV
ncbi:MAG TPA: hypothetical protein VI503_04635 [Gaiellaceae bacterium]|nr:hypothetical protein [Gaiellaceae bacterium]